MKNIFTILLCLIAVTLSAQSFTLKHDNTVLANGASIVVESTVGTSTNTYIEVANNQQTDLFFRVYKQILTDGAASNFTFCVGGTCYVGNMSQELYLGPGASWDLSDETNVFHATYGHPTAGNQSVRYLFVNSDDPNDTTAFTINYTTTTGISDVAKVNKLTAYPNPATTSVTVDYDLRNASNAYVVIRNLTGMEVYRASASASGKSVVDVTSLRAGVYFYGIESDGRMLSSKKLLVK